MFKIFYQLPTLHCLSSLILHLFHHPEPPRTWCTNTPKRSVHLLQQMLRHIPSVGKMLIPAKLKGIVFCPNILKQVKGQQLLEKYFRSIAYEVKDNSWADEKEVVHTNQALACCQAFMAKLKRNLANTKVAWKNSQHFLAPFHWS